MIAMGSKNNPGKFDCYANAEPDEPMFVLLGRDPMASMLVRIWAAARIANRENLDKVGEAQECAEKMEAWAKSKGKNVESANEKIREVLHDIFKEGLQ